jgi:hypothetical protein
MSRKLMAVLISSALVFGNVSTSAWSATDAAGTLEAQSIQTGDPVSNKAPLPAAGAAGVKQAQGFVQDFPLLTIALVAGVIALVWILVDEEDDDDDSTPGT